MERRHSDHGHREDKAPQKCFARGLVPASLLPTWKAKTGGHHDLWPGSESPVGQCRDRNKGESGH